MLEETKQPTGNETRRNTPPPLALPTKTKQNKKCTKQGGNTLKHIENTRRPNKPTTY